MRTEEQMTTIITRATKDLHLGLATKWGFPARVFAGSTFGLAVTMMHECGYSEEQIIEYVRQLMGDLLGSPDSRGAA